MKDEERKIKLITKELNCVQQRELVPGKSWPCFL